MPDRDIPDWLRWAREIQAISQIGLFFSKNAHEESNFSRLQEIAAEILQKHSNLDNSQALKIFQEQSGYATVKVDVRGAIVRDSRILLVQERRDGLWCLPGGWADVGETPSQMVAREVWEESGFTVEPQRLIGVYDANRGGEPLSFFHAYKIVFMCEITAGHPRPSEETAAVDFFEFHNLPGLSVPRTTQRHLDDIQKCLQQPGLPVFFD